MMLTERRKRTEQLLFQAKEDIRFFGNRSHVLVVQVIRGNQDGVTYWGEYTYKPTPDMPKELMMLSTITPGENEVFEEHVLSSLPLLYGLTLTAINHT